MVQVYHYTHTITKKYSFAICIASFAVLVKIVPETFVLHTFVIGDTVLTGPMLYILSGGIEAQQSPDTPCSVFPVRFLIHKELGVHLCCKFVL